MLTLLDLDDDTLLAVMQALPFRLVRGPLLQSVCRRLLTLASSSAALGCHVAFLGGAKNKAITPILEALSHIATPTPAPALAPASTSSTSPSVNFPPLPSSSSQALAKLNRDGGITSVAFGNHSWGSTTTKKLVKLFPALQAIELGSTKKVAHAHGLSDFSLAAIPSLRKFKWGWAFDSDDAVVMNLVRGRELLEELDLSSAEGMGEYSARSGLTDQLLIELGKSCPRLHTLRLQGHLQFTSEGVDALLGGCPALTKLKLNTYTIFHGGGHGGGLSFVKLNQESVDALIARSLDVADITYGLAK